VAPQRWGVLAGDFFDSLLDEGPGTGAAVSFGLAISLTFATVSLPSSPFRGRVRGPGTPGVCTLPGLRSAEGLIAGVDLEGGGQGLSPAKPPYRLMAACRAG